jgi:UDP-N-acetylmuramate-alanine ligase
MSTIHILGIAGTFMGGVAALARELGYQVEGSDQAVYPPMSTQLERLGISLKQGYAPEHISAGCDEVVVGNALSRGNPSVEAVLDAGRRYTSGAQWLSEKVLPGRDTLAVAGTHGKTTTTTILAFLLQAAGREPGFLIGGVAEDFGVSARIGQGREFVVEADEYDTAFFDKRSKFVHYRPLVAILNNLEYDHADIFPDVAAIQRQFHHLVRTVPGRGRLIVNGEDERLAEVLAMGCWTPVERFGFRCIHGVERAAGQRGWQRVRGHASRRRSGHGAVAAAGPAQRAQRPGRAGGGACRGCGCCRGGAGAGRFPQRQAAHGSDWPGQRHHHLR